MLIKNIFYMYEKIICNKKVYFIYFIYFIYLLNYIIKKYVRKNYM